MGKLNEYEKHIHKLDPKLRMVRNGSEEVNANRALREPTMVVQQNVISKYSEDFEQLQNVQESYLSSSEVLELKTPPSLQNPPNRIDVSVFIQLISEDQTLPKILKRNSARKMRLRNRDLVAATVSLDELSELAIDPAVAMIEIAEGIVFDQPLDLGTSDASPQSALPNSNILDEADGGREVLIGIIDVQGFDFSHPDFLKEDGETRFSNIWDQAGTTHFSPRPFGYGAEIKSKQMNRALKEEMRGGLKATTLEPQSSMIPGSHGTHVASIAAGLSGLCPKAEIAAVLVSLPMADRDPRKSFYDSTRIAHAVDYLIDIADKKGKAISINISLGTNGHAHDGSSSTSRWIDYELTTPGRSVSVAAGNSGQEKPSHAQDLGFIMGRIHSSGRISGNKKSKKNTINLEWEVVGNGIVDVSENEMEIWYSPRDLIEIELISPDGTIVGPICPGEYIENKIMPDKRTVVSVYSELFHPANGDNYIALYLSPFYKNHRMLAGIRSGTWIVRLKGLDIRDGLFHAWIERDDPRRRSQALKLWKFPSYFSKKSNVDKYSVSSFACGENIVSVANYDAKGKKINKTSSEGPTRDERKKPNISAPGTRIIAANGFNPDHLWTKKSGTSMSAPYVAGVIGLMMAVNPNLTGAQINGILARTAKPIKTTKFGWSKSFGFGKILLKTTKFRWSKSSGFGEIQAEKCVEQAKLVGLRKDLNESLP